MLVGTTGGGGVSHQEGGSYSASIAVVTTEEVGSYNFDRTNYIVVGKHVYPKLDLITVLLISHKLRGCRR